MLREKETVTARQRSQFNVSCEGLTQNAAAANQVQPIQRAAAACLWGGTSRIVKDPSAVVEGQGVRWRNYLCPTLPTSAHLMPALGPVLQGNFYDPIRDCCTPSGLGVTSRFKII